jgi:chromosome partitioning protein
MRRIAIINQKGGVGKTTTTANLGAAFAHAGKKTFLVDLDPQGHLTLHFGLSVQPDQATVYDVLTASTPVKEARVKARENIDVLPADIDLAAAEAELVSVTGREVLLREALDAFGGEYDAMLIDCAPSLGVLTINALAACTEVVIPLQAHFFALQGLGKLLETVMLVRQRINPHLKVSGIALCMHEATTRLATEVAEDLTKFLEAARGGDKPWAHARLYQTAIRRNIKLAESSSFGQTVFDYAPKSNGAVDYANLAAEIFPGLPKPRATEEEQVTTEVVSDKVTEAVIRAAPKRAEAAPAPASPAKSRPAGSNGAAQRVVPAKSSEDSASRPATTIQASANPPTAAGASPRSKAPTSRGMVSAATPSRTAAPRPPRAAPPMTQPVDKPVEQAAPPAATVAGPPCPPPTLQTPSAVIAPAEEAPKPARRRTATPRPKDMAGV